MTNVEKVYDFLSKAKVYYFLTADGDQPKLRPLGAHFEWDGRILFGVGDFKEVYRQMLADPKVEIVACKPDGHWLRYTGRAVFETDDAYEKKALDAMPVLKSIYNEASGRHMRMFHLEDATAVVIPTMGEGERLL